MGGWENNYTFLILFSFLLVYSKDLLLYFYIGTNIFLLRILTILMDLPIFNYFLPYFYFWCG